MMPGAVDWYLRACRDHGNRGCLQARRRTSSSIEAEPYFLARHPGHQGVDPNSEDDAIAFTAARRRAGSTTWSASSTR